jgi:ubiquinone/menaquinone biosynthesis C-methylase UbiE
LKGRSLAGNDVRVPLSPKKIRGLYDSVSSAYDFFTRYEESTRQTAFAMADVQLGWKVLDVGCGTGKTLIEFARDATFTGVVCGLNISRRMLEKTRKLLLNNHLWAHVHLVLGDTAHCPFRGAAFEVVFCSYMLDLIDTPLIPEVLSEFKRLLKPAGRVVLVSLAKGSKWHNNMKAYEWAYKHAPVLLGGCRPVALEPFLQEAGLTNVSGHFMRAGHLMPTMILRTDKTN